AIIVICENPPRMTASLKFQAVAIATILCIGLFFALKQVILPNVYEPAPSYEEAAGVELMRMSPSNLEIFLQGELKKVRNGEAISYGREQALKIIRQALLERMADQPALLAKLLAMIDEILILNDELIYPDDGEPKSDEDR
ncbi:MAG: hypothetical protein J5I94_21245, partial [Phaeodactylibacter sp.]|nr:hypothetical protein [Phaeodactylibacter sp.]